MTLALLLHGPVGCADARRQPIRAARERREARSSQPPSFQTDDRNVRSSIVVIRSEAGSAELAVPAHGLSLTQRRFLTLLDTSCTLEELGLRQRSSSATSRAWSISASSSATTRQTMRRNPRTSRPTIRLPASPGLHTKNPHRNTSLV